MRILHLNNTANVAVQLRDAQRALGHEAIVVTISGIGNYLNYPEDWRLYPLDGIANKVAFASQVFGLVRWADVVHFHNPYWPSLIHLLKAMTGRKTFIAHYHGLGSVRRWKLMADSATAMILSTPNLRPHCPRGIYIPNPMKPLEPPTRRRRSGRPMRVVHGHTNPPDLERVKGTITIRNVVNRVPEAELVEVQGRPHQEALRIYETCDVAVDQIRIGWYGMFALECMSMGIPTLGYVDDPYRIGNPVYPVDDFTLGETLEQFVRDEELRRRVGEAQRKHVMRIHDPSSIARKVLEVYEARNE